LDFALLLVRGLLNGIVADLGELGEQDIMLSCCSTERRPRISLIETVKLNGLGPQAWLRDVLERIADHPNTGSANCCRRAGRPQRPQPKRRKRPPRLTERLP